MFLCSDGDFSKMKQNLEEQPALRELKDEKLSWKKKNEVIKQKAFGRTPKMGITLRVPLSQ